MVHTDSEGQIGQKLVEDPLQNTGYACQCLERLPRGFINFAFRNRFARVYGAYDIFPNVTCHGLVSSNSSTQADPRRALVKPEYSETTSA
jgi:hypothetical protein